jgi:succinoglycan biosynthesis transport protein ExoP
MAPQIEGPGQLQEFLDILTRRRWQLLLPALVLLTLGIAFAVVVPKKYQVRTQVELRELFLDEEARGAAREQAFGVAENAPEQIRSPKRIQEVLEELKWPEYLTLGEAERADYEERVRDNLDVTVPRSTGKSGSAFVTVEYLDVNKEHAQDFLKALRRAWIEQVVERERTRYDVEYTQLRERQAAAEKEYEKLTREQRDLRAQNEISGPPPPPRPPKQRVEDPTVMRFQDLEGRLEDVGVQLAARQAELEAAREELAGTEPRVPRTRVKEGQSYEAEIAGLIQERLSLEEQLSGIRVEHPRFKQVSRKLIDLEARIQELEDRQTSAEVSQEFEPNPDYQRLEVLVRDLAIQVGRLEAERDALLDTSGDARRELQRLHEIYNEDRKLTDQINIVKTTLEDLRLQVEQKRLRRDVVFGSAGNPFQIIQEVQPPLRPTEPDPVLIVMFALVLGLGVGLSAALIGEFSRSCFRGPADISRALVVPVLGVISPIITRVERRRRALRRLAVGSVSMSLVGAVLFVTWAWASEPDLLGERINATIEDFRQLFL